MWYDTVSSIFLFELKISYYSVNSLKVDPDHCSGSL